MIRLAKARGLVKIQLHNLRKFANGKHKMCDDKPFGGGPGMVMIPGPIFDSIEFLKKKYSDAKVLLMTPQGKPFIQEDAWRFSRMGHLIILCGHYEGVDERVRQFGVDYEISVGDFVTTGGELPAMCVVDSIVRLVPGVVGNQDSIKQESFQDGLLDYPHYTRPRVFRGHAVPHILVSGDHKKIGQWRREQAFRLTRERRPDLLKGESHETRY